MYIFTTLYDSPLFVNSVTISLPAYTIPMTAFSILKKASGWGLLGGLHKEGREKRPKDLRVHFHK